jgi:hypothetical protein
MRSWFVVIVCVLLSVTSVHPLLAQCNDFENLIAYKDVFIRESARDEFGNIYIVGNFRVPNFVIGTTPIPLYGTMSYLLLKFDKNFNLIWAKSGGQHAFGNEVEIDHQGNVVIVGSFFQNISFDCIQFSSRGDNDVFVAKYDQFGHALWAKSSGGAYRENDSDLSIGPDNTIIVSGDYSPNSDMRIDGIQFPDSKGADAFLITFSPTGTAVWGTAIGTSQVNDFPDYIYDTVVDSEGNIIVTGMFESPKLSIGSFTLNRTVISENYFLAKFDSKGKVLWARDTPGPADAGHCVVTDGNDDIFVTGRFLPGSYSIGNIPLSSNGEADVFVAKYSGDGDVINARSFGGSLFDQPRGFCLMPNGNIAVAGNFNSYSLSIGPFTITKAEFAADMFIVIMDNNLTPLCVKRSSGMGNDWVTSLNADRANNLMVSFEGSPANFDEHTFNISPANGFIMVGDNQNFETRPQSNNVFDFTLGEDVVKCAEDQYELKAPTICGATYQWSNGSAVPTINIRDPGQYWVNVTINGATARDTISVFIQTGPVVDLGKDVAICEGESVAFDITQETFSEYLWDDGSTLPTRTINATGFYWAKVTGQCGEATDEINVLIPQDVTFDLGNDRPFCETENLTLSSGITGPVTYLWQDGSSSPEIIVDKPGEYILKVTSGCLHHSDTINVRSLSVDPGKIPNVVTANTGSDSFNDTFILPIELEGARVTIINRQGKTVFSSNHYKNSWPDADQSSGVYYYQILIGCSDRAFKGSIHLLK